MAELRHEMADFRPNVILTITTAIQEVGWAGNFLKCRAVIEKSPYCMVSNYYSLKVMKTNFGHNAKWSLFSDPITEISTLTVTYIFIYEPYTSLTFCQKTYNCCMLCHKNRDPYKNCHPMNIGTHVAFATLLPIYRHQYKNRYHINIGTY